MFTLPSVDDTLLHIRVFDKTLKTFFMNAKLKTRVKKRV